MLAERAAGLVLLCGAKNTDGSKSGGWALSAERGVKPGIGANGRDRRAGRDVGKAKRRDRS